MKIQRLGIFSSRKNFSIGYLKEYDCIRINGLPQPKFQLIIVNLKEGSSTL